METMQRGRSLAIGPGAAALCVDIAASALSFFPLLGDGRLGHRRLQAVDGNGRTVF